MAERLEIKILDANGTPAQYEKVVVAYKTKSGGIEEKTFTSSADGHIKTGIKISKLHRNTFFYFDGGQGHPKVLGQDTQLVGQTHQFKVSSKNPLNFLVLYEYFDQDGANQSITIPDLSYKVFNKGKVIKIGKTDKNGMTSAFKAIKSQGYQIQIKPKHSSTYIIPIIRKKYQDSQSPTVKYDGTTLYAICLETYVGFKVVNNKNKGIPNVKVWLVDKNGKQQGDTRTTDKNGRIKPFAQNFSRTVKVSLKGCELTLKEKEVVIPKHQGEDPYHVIEIKTRTCSTGLNNPNNKATLAANTRLPIVYDLESKELSVFRSNDYKNLVKNLSNVDKLMAKVHMQRSQVADALKARDASMLKTAEDAMIRAEADAQDEIEQDFSTIADMKEIFLVKTAVASADSNGTTIERRYVRRDYFEDTIQPTRINQSQTNIPTPEGDPPPPDKPNLLYDPAGFAKEALADRIKEISASIEGELGTEGEIDLNVLDYLLPSSANEISELITKSDKYQVDGEAQWLRMVGGAGMNGSADWNLDDKIGIEGGFNANGKLILCEASISPIMALPSLEGWHLKATFEDGIKIDLGSLRLIVSCEISGFAGVNIGIEGAGSIKIKDGAQKLVSAARDPKQTMTSAWDANKNMPALSLDYKDINHTTSDDEIEQLQEKHNVKGSVAISAFIGVEGGIEPKGGIEWLPPEEENFVSFASVSATIAGSFGIGGSLDFYVFLDARAGKFKIRAKAAACYGGGGKLGLVFEVNGGQIEEFLKWTFYQLVNAGFRKIVHILDDAFTALTQLSVMYLGGESSLTKSLISIGRSFDIFSDSINTDSKRYDLAIEITKGEKKEMLLCATPNGKGILIYNISRHSWYSHALSWPDFDFSLTDGLSIKLLTKRKEAIIKIFTTVTTYPEWDNVLQHMNRDGVKGYHTQELIGKSNKSFRQENEAHVLRFLSYGINNIDTPLTTLLNNIKVNKIIEKNDTGNSYIDQYLNMLGRLIKGYYPKGEKVVANTDSAYEKYRMLAKVDYINPNFYAAKNPQHFDASILNPRGKLADGTYHA
ncbi:hypothetical protein ACT3TI_12740 [Psychrobacter sp. AOP22-C1-22]|uniref:hypothetical protein n=1 Tax=unclassified Psychrobacter TaxID=196806 RepID=UPI00178793BD|nr:hypothetical protein [Psychrobacter sp. FME6]MBE0407711.1 hypothetical protein [Psychrobacter sp. FME6]